jgi:hypothetical protein
VSAVDSWEAEALADLQWHWGEAYLIRHLGGRWVAQRRDSRETISAPTAAGLGELITQDYAARPVARRNGGAE